MDRIEITTEDLDKLLEWRDEHCDEVRNSPCPLRAVEIRIVDNGNILKCFRDCDLLRIHLNVNGLSAGSFQMKMIGSGEWKLLKNHFRKEYSTKENIESALTVYMSIMALMTYGCGSAPASSTPNQAPTHTLKKKPKSKTQKKKPNVIYILKGDSKRLVFAHKSSHASPSGVFNVRGHFRHYKNGKVVWIPEYQKGNGNKKSKIYRIGGK